jgi:hypothetical protein
MMKVREWKLLVAACICLVGMVAGCGSGPQVESIGGDVRGLSAQEPVKPAEGGIPALEGLEVGTEAHIAGDTLISEETRRFMPPGAVIEIDPGGRMEGGGFVPPNLPEEQDVVGHVELPEDVARGQLGPAGIKPIEPPAKPPDPTEFPMEDRPALVEPDNEQPSDTGDSGEIMPIDPDYIPPSVREQLERERKAQEEAREEESNEEP